MKEEASKNITKKDLNDVFEKWFRKIYNHVEPKKESKEDAQIQISDAKLKPKDCRIKKMKVRKSSLSSATKFSTNSKRKTKNFKKPLFPLGNSDSTFFFPGFSSKRMKLSKKQKIRLKSTNFDSVDRRNISSAMKRSSPNIGAKFV